MGRASTEMAKAQAEFARCVDNMDANELRAALLSFVSMANVHELDRASAAAGFENLDAMAFEYDGE